jgi:hypothetical protein
MIVDNSIHAFGYHLLNGIPIPSFFGQHWDNELSILGDMLLEIIREGNQTDVRVKIDKMFSIVKKIYP